MSSNDASGPQRSRSGRVLLIGSLALNLFLVGLLVGGWVAGVRLMGPGVFATPGALVGIADMDLRRVAAMLPEPSRTKLRRIMRQGLSDLRPALHEAGRARAHIDEALRTKPFNVDHMRVAFEGARNADSRVRTLFHRTFLEFVETLDDQERQFLYQAIKNMRRDPQSPQFGGRRPGPDELPRMRRRDRFMPPMDRQPAEQDAPATEDDAPANAD